MFNLELQKSVDQTKPKKKTTHKCLGRVNDVDWKQIPYQELNSSILMGRQYTMEHDWDNKIMRKEKEAKLRKRDRGQTQSCFKSM